MSWLSKAMIGFGLLFLTHACYSAREHSALQASTIAPVSLPSTHTAPSITGSSVPLDISIETITAIFLVCLGLVTGTPELRPIQWRVWAGKIEREGEQGFLEGGVVAKDYIGNPFKALESRPGFIDIRKQRQEFAEWVREGGGATTESKN